MTVKSTKTPTSAPPSAAPPTTATPPGTAAPIYTMSRADEQHRKQQILKRLDSVRSKGTSRSKAFINACHKSYLMCSEREYRPYVDLDVGVNFAMLYITCEHERQQTDEVVKMQREVARRARLLEEAQAEEKRLDAEFWELVSKYKKG